MKCCCEFHSRWHVDLNWQSVKSVCWCLSVYRDVSKTCRRTISWTRSRKQVRCHSVCQNYSNASDCVWSCLIDFIIIIIVAWSRTVAPLRDLWQPQQTIALTGGFRPLRELDPPRYVEVGLDDDSSSDPTSWHAHTRAKMKRRRFMFYVCLHFNHFLKIVENVVENKI